MASKAIKSPIQNRIPGVFIPVRDIHAAKAWYDTILGLDGGEVQFGHLYVIEMQGVTNLVLDEMPHWRGDDGDICPHEVPVVQLGTDDIEASYAFMKEQGAELVSGIEDGFYFVFEDPDGNRLMICQC